MENKTKPTESQIEVLMSDWLGNLRMGTEGNYTHKGKGGIHRNSDESFQDYLLGNISHLDPVDLIKKARQAAGLVVDAVTTEPVSVFVGGNGSFQTTSDGRPDINLATDYFDDKSLSAKQKVDIMLGLASHEAAHVVYTKEEDFQKNLKKNTSPQLLELKKEIWNILEDERIEFHLGEDRPGLAGTLGATKEHYFKRLVRQLKQNGEMPKEPLPKLLTAIKMGIRYPSEMTREQVEDNFDELDAIRRTLTPYPLTSEDVWAATDRVMDIIKDTVKKQIEEEHKKQEEQQQQQQSSEGQGAQNPQQGDGSKDDGQNTGQQQNQPGNGKPEDQNKSGNKSGDEGDSTNKGKAPKPKAPTKAEIEKAMADALSTEEGKNVMKALKDDDNQSSGNNMSMDLFSSDAQRYANEDDSETDSAGPGDPKVFVFKPKGTPESYMKAERDIKPFVPAMSKALACKSQDSEYELRGLPSGKLNTNKLVALKMGNKTIFNKKGAVTCSSACVCMLIDESGSMSGAKLQAARRAAILVNEAVKRIPNVTYYCYGYTDDRLNVYSEGTKTSKWALGATEARGGTPTGKAMAMCSKRVRRISPAPCLMLVLTDGYPDNSAEVIRQDEKLRKDRFIPVGIGIQSSAVSRTFKQSVVLNDMGQFPFDLGRITKGALDKMLIKTESI